MISAIIKLWILNRFGECPSTFDDAFRGLLKWLAYSQDSSDDNGSSAGYSLRKGWLMSYPETTGYIIWTLINHYRLFDDESCLERAAKMAKWEQKVQWEAGGIPGTYGQPDEQMVVFNTGMVLMGWSAYYQQTGYKPVLQSAIKAADWIESCQSNDGAWLKGVSKAASGGHLAYNAMVAWGLSELYLSTGIDRFKQAALKGARYYAGYVDRNGWPDYNGFTDNKDRFRPLTHTIGYTLAGIYETAALLHDDPLRAIAIKMASGLAGTVTKNGFIPGRIGQGFKSRARWSCLTGSAQIVYIWLRMVQQGCGEIGLFYKALSVLEYIRKTQRINTGDSGIDYAIAGSFPFSFRGYCPVSYPNWAAKFTLDCYHLLYRLSQNKPYRRILRGYGFEDVI